MSWKVVVALTGLDTASRPLPKVATAVSVWLPTPRAIAGEKDQAPPGLASAVPTTAPSSVMVTVAPGVAVPEMLGVVTLIVEPLTGVVITGASTAHAFAAHVAPLGQSAVTRQRTQARLVVSHTGTEPPQSPFARHPVTTSNVMAALDALVTACAPAPSVAVAETVWLATDRSDVGS